MDREGWLNKQGEKGLVKAWKRRWFVLKGSRLLYYVNVGDAKEKGSIELDAVTAVTRRGAREFSLLTPTRLWLLLATKEEEASAWMEALAPLVPTQTAPASATNTAFGRTARRIDAFLRSPKHSGIRIQAERLDVLVIKYGQSSSSAYSTLRIDALEKENAGLSRALQNLRAELASAQTSEGKANPAREAEHAAVLAAIREAEATVAQLKNQVKAAIEDTRARMAALESAGVPAVQEISARLAETRTRLAEREAEYTDLKSLVLGEKNSHDSFQIAEVLRLRAELARKDEELKATKAAASPALTTPADKGEKPAVTYKHGMRFSDDNFRGQPQGMAAPVSAITKSSPMRSVIKCMALYSFERRNSNELTIRRNDVIRVLDTDSSGWWKGEVGGKIGLFPGNYAVVIEDENRTFHKRLSSRRSQFIEHIAQQAGLSRTDSPSRARIPTIVVNGKLRGSGRTIAGREPSPPPVPRGEPDAPLTRLEPLLEAAADRLRLIASSMSGGKGEKDGSVKEKEGRSTPPITPVRWAAARTVGGRASPAARTSNRGSLSGSGGNVGAKDAIVASSVPSAGARPSPPKSRLSPPRTITQPTKPPASATASGAAAGPSTPPSASKDDVSPPNNNVAGLAKWSPAVSPRPGGVASNPPTPTATITNPSPLSSMEPISPLLFANALATPTPTSGHAPRANQSSELMGTQRQHKTPGSGPNTPVGLSPPTSPRTIAVSNAGASAASAQAAQAIAAGGTAPRTSAQLAAVATLIVPPPPPQSPVWTPDVSAPVCYSCRVPFTFFKRRHHCRACGHTFCNSCSTQEIALPDYGFNSAVRVCTGCYPQVQGAQGRPDT